LSFWSLDGVWTDLIHDSGESTCERVSSVFWKLSAARCSMLILSVRSFLISVCVFSVAAVCVLLAVARSLTLGAVRPSFLVSF
jgi:hypothetical protein